MSEPLSIGSVSMRLYPHDLSAREQIAEARVQARLAVEAGFDGVMIAEHHCGFPGYFPNPQIIGGFLLAAMPHENPNPSYAPMSTIPATMRGAPSTSVAAAIHSWFEPVFAHGDPTANR